MNLQSNKSIFLFTAEFPYGKSESSFLKAEIPILAKRFSKVYLIPLRARGEKMTHSFDGNFTVLDIYSNQIYRKSKITHFVKALQILFIEILSKNGLSVIKNFRYHLSQSMNYSSIAEALYANLTKIYFSHEDIFYTYWFDEWTTVLCLLKKRSLIKNSIVTRAHGFDLYDYRNSLKYIFPRNFQLGQISMVFSISIDGLNYLRNQYPNYAQKVSYSPLGTIQVESRKDVVKQTKHIRVVSCSSVIELKRINKIIEVLEHSTKPIEWIHFGDGPLLNEIKELCKRLPVNVSAIFKGQVDNSDIIEYYQKNYVDFFINVSVFEGVPVSIMEAISFGIPVIATNVGGVSEIVNKVTGNLFPIDFEPVMVCSLIESREYSKAERETIIDFWRTNYSAENNYTKFCENLILTN